MPSWFDHDFRVRYTTLEKERTKRVGLKDLTPRFDRPTEFRVLATDGFPKFGVGWFEQAPTPNGDGKQPIRADKTLQLPDPLC
jgi:hypothetical protein